MSLILERQAPQARARQRYGEGPNQFGDLFSPEARDEGPLPLVMMIHGGFWRAKYDLAHAGHVCAALAANGVGAWNVEYRRVGNAGGGWPGSFQDIRAAYRFIVEHAAQHELDGKRIAVMGHSAGGQLALCLAAHEAGLKAVVSLAGVVDLCRAYELHLSDDAVAGFLQGTPEENADGYREADPMQLKIPGVEQVLVHGTNDDTVPVAFSRDYVRAKKQKGERAQLLELEGADHFDVIDPESRAWPAILVAIQSALGVTP